MKVYAILDSNNICTGISQLTGEVIKPNMIDITNEIDPYDFMWKKYDNEQWSAEKFEPQSTAPLDDFQKAQQDIALMQQALDELILGGGV